MLYSLLSLALFTADPADSALASVAAALPFAPLLVDLENGFRVCFRRSHRSHLPRRRSREVLESDDDSDEEGSSLPRKLGSSLRLLSGALLPSGSLSLCPCRAGPTFRPATPALIYLLCALRR